MTETQPSAAEAVAERIFNDGTGAIHAMTVYLGSALGLWAAIGDHPGSTCAEVAATTGLDEWYVREWVQAEATAGLLTTDAEDLHTARVTLSDGVADALVDETNAAFIAGLPHAVAAVANVLPNLLLAFRTGDGIPMDEYGPEVVYAQSALNRVAFVNEMVQSWLPQLPDIEARLRDTANPARVADIGCGTGWAAIELAKAFPHLRIDGVDADEPTVQQATANADAEGVGDRVTFHLVDAATSPLEDGAYDLVTFFECVHDMARPVEVLEAARRAVAPGGTVLVMDERAAETRREPGDQIETYFATVSVLWCLPQSRNEPDCEAPGTVMRPAQLEAFAKRAGYSGIDIAPIDHPFFRFYRLVA